MKKCAHCGRLGLFFFLDGDGLCEKCAEVEKKRRMEQEKLRLEQARISALEQVKKVSAAFRDIIENGGHLPKYSMISQLDTCDVPAGCVARLREDCALICTVLKDWENIPFFEEAVHDFCDMEGETCFPHPDIDFGLRLWKSSKQDDFRKTIPLLIEKVQKLDKALELYGPYEYSRYRVVGTSFDNDDGTSRQDILWDLDHKMSPFRDEVVIRLEKYKFGDEDAIAVFANDLQIGHISREDAKYFVLPRWDRYAGVSEYSMRGGGHGLNYGISIEVMFYKEH